MKIKAGTTVVWVNKSGAIISINSVEHPTHEVYPPLNLGTVADGGSVSLQFEKRGSYKYHDHLNPGNRGEIVVK